MKCIFFFFLYLSHNQLRELSQRAEYNDAAAVTTESERVKKNLFQCTDFYYVLSFCHIFVCCSLNFPIDVEFMHKSDDKMYQKYQNRILNT